jgi:hypothetical protein
MRQFSENMKVAEGGGEFHDILQFVSKGQLMVADAGINDMAAVILTMGPCTYLGSTYILRITVVTATGYGLDGRGVGEFESLRGKIFSPIQRIWGELLSGDKTAGA